MHRRARHLNARHAGAGLVFDARRLTGLSNGNAVVTLTDFSGNGWDGIQGTSGFRAIYRTASKGGQPGIEFDGVDDVYNVTASGALDYSKNVGHMHIGGVAIDTTPGNVNTPHVIITLSGGTGNTRAGFFTRLTTVSGVQSGARRLDADSLTSSASAGVTTSYFVGRSNCDYSGGTIRAVYNGVATSNASLPSSGNTSNTASSSVIIGQRLVGLIYSIYVINKTVSESLQRRLDHSMAFAFKIQTS